MHVNNYTLPTPPQTLLDQCYQVIVPMGPKITYREMKKWCRDTDASYVWCELLDTSDASYTHDYVAAFWFIKAEDATMFTLKFK